MVISVNKLNISRKDYEDALTQVEYLIEHEPDHPLVDMLVAKIAHYEDEAEEFAEFNERIAAQPAAGNVSRNGD